MADRLDTVAKMLAEGLPQRRIEAILGGYRGQWQNARGKPVTRRTIRNYIKRVIDEAAQATRDIGGDREETFQRHQIGMTVEEVLDRALRNDADEPEKLRVAVSVLGLKARLAGLYRDKLQVQVQTDRQLERFLAGLAAYLPADVYQQVLVAGRRLIQAEMGHAEAAGSSPPAPTDNGTEE